MIRTPLPVNTSSNAAVSLLARSRIRNSNWAGGVCTTNAAERHRPRSGPRCISADGNVRRHLLGGRCCPPAHGRMVPSGDRWAFLRRGPSSVPREAPSCPPGPARWSRYRRAGRSAVWYRRRAWMNCSAVPPRSGWASAIARRSSLMWRSNWCVVLAVRLVRLARVPRGTGGLRRPGGWRRIAGQPVRSGGGHREPGSRRPGIRDGTDLPRAGSAPTCTRGAHRTPRVLPGSLSRSRRAWQ